MAAAPSSAWFTRLCWRRTREYPRERREAAVDVQIRANSSGVVRRRAVAVADRGGRRVADDDVARRSRTSRRVALRVRRRGNSRREQRTRAFESTRHGVSRARSLRLARGGVRARARRRGQRDRRRAASLAVLGDRPEFKRSRRRDDRGGGRRARRRGAVRRCVSRRGGARRRMWTRGPRTGREGRGSDRAAAGSDDRRVTSRRLRRASFYAWRRRADAHAAAWVLAGRVREG